MVTVEQDDVLALLNEKLEKRVLQVEPLKLGRASVRVSPEDHRDAVKVLLESDEDAGLSALTGVDLGKTIELMYHIWNHGKIVTVRTEVTKENPRINTITDLIPGANFHEREVADLLGVTFEGHPNPKRFVLPDNWPDNVFPLRKDAQLPKITDLSSNSADEGEKQGTVNEVTVNIVVGPQHPALLEPEKFSLKVDGETVTDVEPRLGYVHRGVEKAAEQRTYLQDTYLVERICGICNACHATCFCQTVENIMKTDVPRRVKFLRTIILELNRLHSHMLLLGHAGLEIGYETLFQYMWRDRELVMDMIECLTGNRVNTSFFTIGGVRRDLKEEMIPRIKTDLANLNNRMDFYKRIYEDDVTLKMRTENVGVLSKSDAVKLCVVGPVARGSGVIVDVRKGDPYAAYDEIPFNVITQHKGDSLARLRVRVDEVYESINIINYALDNLPAGPYRVKVPRVVAPGEAISRVEAPRGELLYYVKSNGTAHPERVKVRTPTFANILSFVHIAKGINIADVPASFVTLDPCFSCTDR